MGFFTKKEKNVYDLLQEIDEVRKAQKSSVSNFVKMCEPTGGRQVTLEITVKEPILKYCAQQIETSLNMYGAEVRTEGRKVTAIYPNSQIAEMVRKNWE